MEKKNKWISFVVITISCLILYYFLVEQKKKWQANQSRTNVFVLYYDLQFPRVGLHPMQVRLVT